MLIKIQHIMGNTNENAVNVARFMFELLKVKSKT